MQVFAGPQLFEIVIIVLDKKNSIIFATLIALLFILSCDKGKNGETVASAGEATLTESELEYLLPSGFDDEMTDEVFRLIDNWAKEELLAQAAEDMDLQKRPEIAQRLEEARRMILASAYEREVISSRVDVDSAEVYQYYLDHLDDFVRHKDEVRCAHIMVEDSSQAAIVDSLLDTLAFEEVAKEFSNDPGNIDIGYYGKDDMHPELARIAFDLPEGEHSGPIKTEFGYHFIKLIDYASKGTTREFMDVREMLEDIVAEEKFNEAYQTVMDSLIGEKLYTLDSSAVLKKVKHEK